jgi:peptidoglycan hydrolase CwlO-like protein
MNSEVQKELRYLGAQIEETNSNVKLILEVLMPMKEKVDRIPHIEARLTSLESDVKIIKVAVRETNRDLKDHERRITKLEHKPA